MRTVGATWMQVEEQLIVQIEVQLRTRAHIRSVRLGNLLFGSRLLRWRSRSARCGCLPQSIASLASSSSHNRRQFIRVRLIGSRARRRGDALGINEENPLLSTFGIYAAIPFAIRRVWRPLLSWHGKKSHMCAFIVFSKCPSKYSFWYTICPFTNFLS